LISDVFDVAQVFNFAVAGIATGKGISRGVRERTTFEEFLEQRGMQPGIARTLTGLLLDIGLDPTTYIGIGALGKGIRAVPGGARVLEAVGKGGKAIAARVGLAFTPTQEVAFRVIDQAIRKEGVAAEQTAALVRGLRESAEQVARGDPVRSRLYRKALGGYFDVGADAIVSERRLTGQLAAEGLRTVETTPQLQRIRQSAEVAQRNYLQALPQDVRTYVDRWAPVVRETEENLLDNLVRVGRIKPETADVWRGFHLRPFYGRFQNPESFVEFLQKSDPARAVDLLSTLEHAPARGVGRGIPSEVGKARRLTSVERGALGEVPEADVRIAASHPIYVRAIARGEMLQAIARDYARPELEQILALGADATKLYRRMPTTETWGALAGKVVPKEIHDLLLSQLEAPTTWERVLGWWKSLKVVDNPATHGRNIRSMLTQQVPAAIGLRAFNPAVWVNAIRDVAMNRESFQEAKQVASWAYDLFTTRERLRVAQRLDQSKTLADYFMAPFRAYHSFMARAYNFEDLVGRQAIYRVMRGRGIAPEAAAMAADRAMINYRRLPPLLDKARRKGFYPFVAWPYGVVTQVLPLALQRPGQSFASLKAVRAFTEQLTPEEERALPRYMRTGGIVKLGDRVLALLPWLRDPERRPQGYDLTYELMFGDIAESGTPLPAIAAVLSGRAPENRQLMSLLTPLGQLVAEVSLNVSALTGAEIQRPEEPYTKRLLHLGRGIVPATAFDLAETAAAKTGFLGRAGLTPVSPLAQAVTGTPTALGKEPPGVAPALIRTLAGAKVVPIDVPAEQRARRVELRARLAEIDRRMRSVMRSRALEEPLRRQRLLELRRERRNVQETFVREGVVP
jgi:hypothetical protein